MNSFATRAIRYCGVVGACAGIMLSTVYVTKTAAQNAATPAGQASPIYGVTIPPAYRDWKLISLNHLVTNKVDQIRAQLGNDVAIKAFKDGTLPFPDGAIIAAIHWNNVPSEANNKVLNGPFPGAQSSIAGAPVNVQFMVKDSKKFAASGGWGFADFKQGTPGDRALHAACFACHVPAKDHDYVFAHYAPEP